MDDSISGMGADNPYAAGLGLTNSAVSGSPLALTPPLDDSYVANLLSDRNNPWVQDLVRPDGTVDWSQYSDGLEPLAPAPYIHPQYPDQASLDAALDAYIGQNPSIMDSLPPDGSEPEPPNPWMQGIGLAASGWPIPDAPASQPADSPYPNPWLLGLSQAVAARPSPQPYSDPHSINAVLNAYLAAQNPQSNNLYPNPAPPLTGYEGIVPTPQPPYPTAAQPTGIPSKQTAPLAMFAGPPAQINALISSPPQPANNPPATNLPNPISAGSPDAYLYKLLNGTYTAPPFPTDAPTAANLMTQPAVNPLAPNLPQDTSTLMRATNPLPPLDGPSNAVTFMSTARVDADGAPDAYHPISSKGRDRLANAKDGEKWVGVYAPNNQPVIQGPDDPAPTFYVSQTRLEDQTKNESDPNRYVNAAAIPYIVLPKNDPSGAKLGDIATVVEPKTGAMAHAIFADTKKRGEISIALAEKLGINADPRGSGDQNPNLLYIVYPGSGIGIPLSVDQINQVGEARFQQWGGQARVNQLTAPKQ